MSPWWCHHDDVTMTMSPWWLQYSKHRYVQCTCRSVPLPVLPWCHKHTETSPPLFLYINWRGRGCQISTSMPALSWPWWHHQTHGLQHRGSPVQSKYAITIMCISQHPLHSINFPVSVCLCAFRSVHLIGCWNHVTIMCTHVWSTILWVQAVSTQEECHRYQKTHHDIDAMPEAHGRSRELLSCYCHTGVCWSLRKQDEGGLPCVTNAPCWSTDLPCVTNTPW